MPKYLDNSGGKPEWVRITSCIVILSILAMSSVNCRKIIQIPPPANSITIEQVFASDDEANSAIVGIYSSMINNRATLFSDGAMSIYEGMSADELILFNQSNTDQFQFQFNQLISNNGIISGNFWSPAYKYIYEANAVIAGLQNNNAVSDSVEIELTGEAKFVRAFCNFYLINLFGNVPLVNSTNWNNTDLLGRAEVAQIYQQIISDLQDAQIDLPADYSVGNGERIRPNKWAATALLARAYLFTSDWADAISESGTIINNTGLFGLVTGIGNVFNANSEEAIWQLQLNTSIYPFNATTEGSEIIPLDSTSPPFVYASSQLLGAFEPGDLRRATWIDSVDYMGVLYYFPFKYNIGPAQEVANGQATQYYMMMRLAEQYLIRAEAEANLQNGGNNAIADLNMIRVRAGLPTYQGATDKASVLSAIYHERQVELFAEWGHRWLDLKRWGIASLTLTIEKGFSVSSDALLYPIPITELETDPNLTQNSGY